MKICIDAGHGGKDPGATVLTLKEKDFNLLVASNVYAQLMQTHSVKMTRFDDSYISLPERCDIANDFGADLFVSIHANAATVEAAKGFEVFCISSTGEKYAHSVLDCLFAAFPDKIKRGVKFKRFTVLMKTKMPAILIECGFMTNPAGLHYLKDERSEVLIATAITQGILKMVKAAVEAKELDAKNKKGATWNGF